MGLTLQLAVRRVKNITRKTKMLLNVLFHRICTLQKKNVNLFKRKILNLHEDAPKRTVSSYMYFAKEKRQSVQKKNPKSSPTEISKLLGEMWNKLEKGKAGKKGTKMFDDMAAIDKVRYVKEKEEYDVVVQKRNVVSEQENEESFQQDKVEAMKLYLKLNKISTDITSKVVDENNQCKQASAVISDDVKKVY